MRAPEFRKWFGQFTRLNRSQREQVRSALAHGAGLARFGALLDAACRESRCCPRCASRCWVRHGHAHGLQRYRCRGCGRTFNDLSGTPLARLRRREQWLAYCDCLVEGKSVRASANAVGVHRNTAFRWRHRFVGQFRQQRTEVLAGIVEADEMFLLESQKGSRQLRAPNKTFRARRNVEDSTAVRRDGTTQPWRFC